MTVSAQRLEEFWTETLTRDLILTQYILLHSGINYVKLYL